MSLREDMQKYEQITGESAEHVPIIRIGSVLDGYEIAMKEKEINNNNFEEVVDFFNDIMETLYKDYNDYKVSSESVIYARNRVYDVFSRRYKIKEIERNENISCM